MPKIVNTQDVLNKVKNKIFKYFVFTIVISWSPIFVAYFICFMFSLEYKNVLTYISEICFMTIALSTNNLRDLSESSVLKKGRMLLSILYTFNVANVILCILFFASFNSFELLDAETLQPQWKQFWYVLGSYLMAASMGIGVQIGAGIEQIKRTSRRKNNEQNI